MFGQLQRKQSLQLKQLSFDLPDYPEGVRVRAGKMLTLEFTGLKRVKGKWKLSKANHSNNRWESWAAEE
eukprot:scaffold15896_cov60-Cyclotella_meneghiniana.AAC.2